MDDNKIVNNSDGYNRLYLELKNKFAQEILISIQEMKTEHSLKIREILGGKYELLKLEEDELSTKIQNIRNEFFASSGYVNAQNKLKDIKSKIDSETDQNESALLVDDLKHAIGDMSTLNIQCDNKVKELNEKLKQIKKSIEDLISNKEKEINDYKESLYKETKIKVLRSIANFNKELNALKMQFGITATNEYELPIDVEEILNNPKTTFDISKKEILN